jgi:hypothetical protein
MVGTARGSDLGMLWTLVRGQASRRVPLDASAVSDLRTGMVGFIALGIFVAVPVLIYFAWALYQLLVLEAT